MSVHTIVKWDPSGYNTMWCRQRRNLRVSEWEGKHQKHLEHYGLKGHNESEMREERVNPDVPSTECCDHAWFRYNIFFSKRCQMMVERSVLCKSHQTSTTSRDKNAKLQNHAGSSAQIYSAVQVSMAKSIVTKPVTAHNHSKLRIEFSTMVVRRSKRIGES